MGAVSGGIWGSELHQVNMRGWENFFVVTEKWDRRQCKDWKKKTLAYEGDVPKYEWTLCDIFIFWSFLEMHMKINTKIKCVHVFL